MLVAAILVPLGFALVALAIPSNRVRPWVLPFAGAAQLGVAGLLVGGPDVSAADGWLALDDLGRVVLGAVTVLFFLCGTYAVGYLHARSERPNRLLCSVLPVYLGMMTLMILSHHLGLMWVAIEASTLSAAPLLRFSRTPRSLEATWKYLLLGSVGVALALFGSFFLAYAALHAGQRTTLLFEDLVRLAPNLSKPWLHGSFVLLLVGYGTKMGLAPLHSWKPDAYGESPGLVGALLAGGMTNCAFLALARFHRICVAAGEAEFARGLLVVLGLASMAVACAFMVRQRDFKRLLAYSSVEHMGILVLALGIGGAATFGALFHMVNNCIAKCVMFLAAGNLHRSYGGKRADQVTGATRRNPLSGWAWLFGFLAITGSPPFGPFFSLFVILTATLAAGKFATAALFVLFLTVIFMGMGVTVFRMTFGDPPEHPGTGFREGVLTGAPIVAGLALLLWMGVWLPEPLAALLRDAAASLDRVR